MVVRGCCCDIREDADVGLDMGVRCCWDTRDDADVGLDMVVVVVVVVVRCC